MAALLVVPASSTLIALVPHDPALIGIKANEQQPVAAEPSTVVNGSNTIAEVRLEGNTPRVTAGVSRRSLAGPAEDVAVALQPELLAAAALAERPAPLQPVKYTVAQGDTVWTIAERFRVAPEAVLYSNELADQNLLQVGRELVLPPVPGLLHRVQEGDSMAALAARYSAEPRRVADANGLQSPDMIRVGSTLIVPDGRVPEPPAPAQAPAQVASPAPENGAKLADNLVVPEVELPRPARATSAQAEFILTAAVAARDSQRATGVPASVTIAQAILESTWGRSKLSAEHKNYFGIKAFGRPGSAGVADYNTWEVVNGENVVVPAAFRAYVSMTDSFADHGRFFVENRRYGAAMKVAGDPRAFAREIAAAGYATDPGYPDKLIGLMNQYDLYVYDLR